MASLTGRNRAEAVQACRGGTARDSLEARSPKESFTSDQGPVVVVAGATGVVGSGPVQAWIDAGATVVAVSRSAARLGELRTALNRGETLKNAALNAFTLGIATECARSAVRVNNFCIHIGVAPFGGSQNQLGFPPEGDSARIGPAFVGITKRDTRGQVIQLTNWAEIDGWA